MSTTDKILQIIKQTPSLSCKEIDSKLRASDTDFRESYRTVQNHITKLYRDNIIHQHTVNGKLVYTVGSLGIAENNVFYAKLWNELFTLHDKIGADNSAEQEYNFFKLRGLVLMLPVTIRKELAPTFEKVLNRIKIQDWALKIIYMDIDEDGGNMPDAIDSQAGNVNYMFELIGKVADALHNSLENKTE